MRSSPSLRCRLSAALFGLAALAVLVPAGGAAGALERPLTGTLVGEATDVRLPRVPTTCETSAGGGFRHAGSGALLDELLGLDGGRVDVALGVGRSATGAYLEPGSRLTLTTQRGLLQLDLKAGSCGSAPLTFTGDVLAGTAIWTVDAATSTGGYAGATGTGTAQITATLRSGGELPWSIELGGGSADALQPQLTANLIRSYWGRLGTQYSTRMASAVFTVTNTGAGTAYDAAVADVSAPTGVTAVQVFPADLDELSPGESVDVTVRYQVGITGRRSGPLLVGRTFDTTLHLASRDALEVPLSTPLVVRVSTPAFPPSL